jgi:hypothetical protein
MKGQSGDKLMEYIIDYPDLCQHCQQAIRQAHYLIVEGLASNKYVDDPEGPAMMAYDQGWTCASQGRECSENKPPIKPTLRHKPGDPIGIFISDMGTLWAFHQMGRFDDERCSLCGREIQSDETSFINRDGSMILCANCVIVEEPISEDADEEYFKVTDRYNHNNTTIVCRKHLDFVNEQIKLQASMHGKTCKYKVEKIDHGPCAYCKSRRSEPLPTKGGN